MLRIGESIKHIKSKVLLVVHQSFHPSKEKSHDEMETRFHRVTVFALLRFPANVNRERLNHAEEPSLTLTGNRRERSCLSPLLCEPSCDSAYVPTLLSRAFSRPASGRRGDVLLL